MHALLARHAKLLSDVERGVSSVSMVTSFPTLPQVPYFRFHALVELPPLPVPVKSKLHAVMMRRAKQLNDDERGRGEGKCGPCP